jgi:DNA-binding NarL/FixJ family response regulator
MSVAMSSESPVDGPGPPGGTTGEARIGVMIVDDHEVFAQALALAIDATGDQQCIGVATSADEALALAETARPDAVIMDLGLGDDDGLDLTRRLMAHYPGLGVLVLTGQNPSPELVEAVADAGAAGFLPKLVSLSAVVDAVGSLSEECFTLDRRTVRVLCNPAPSPAAQSVDDASPLTRRERDIVELLVSGVDIQSAAARLGITVNTARGYVKNLYGKLGVHNQLELVAIALRRGLAGDGLP